MAEVLVFCEPRAKVRANVKFVNGTANPSIQSYIAQCGCGWIRECPSYFAAEEARRIHGHRNIGASIAKPVG